MDNTEYQRDRNRSRPVRALVLSGGGGRGAYEVGVAKACRERGFEFDWIVGTSIGAINATMIAQGDLEGLEEVWCRIQSQDVYRLPNPHHLRRVFFGQRLGFLDTSPLESLLKESVDLERLRSSKTNVAFVTTDLCSLETRLITSDEIHSTSALIDTLMAASAVPLLFPPRKLNGTGCWIDGGLVRNTPIQAAIHLGAREIYAVLVEPDSVKACPSSITQLISRLLEIILDQSARSGIAHVTQYNRMVELRQGNANEATVGASDLVSTTVRPTDGKDGSLSSHQGLLEEGIDLGSPSTNGDDRVKLFIIKPGNEVGGSLLEIDPATSQWLIRLGYEDIISSCVHVGA